MTTASEQLFSGGAEKGPEPKLTQESTSGLMHRKTTVIAPLSLAAILLYLVLRFGFHTTPRTSQIPLLATLVSRRAAGSI